MKVVRGQYRSKTPDAVDYYHITGTVDQPQIVEFTVEIDGIRANRLEFSRRDVRPQRLSRYAEVRDYIFKYPKVAFFADDKRLNLWIDSIELEGPLPRAEPVLGAKALFDNKEPKEFDEQAARKIIERFAFEAFRHQTPDAGYVDRLVKIFAASLERGAKPIDALKDALVVVLATPRFLFLEEPSPASDKKTRPLTDRELAIRLAYFLWDAPPDEELYRIAEQGRLHETEALTGQVGRLLASSRSDRFVENFVSQWLELDRLDSIDPAGTASDRYDDAVHRQSRREVLKTFRFLIDENAPASDLLDARYVVVNSLLASFYGLDGVAGDDFRKVSLPVNSADGLPEHEFQTKQHSVRGGLLGQSAILTLTGTGVRTSPVERGAYVLRKLLHRPPPPAPANVPMLNEETIGQRSIRDTLAKHQAAPQCASCHRRIDPLGFALENFDPVGLWRTSVRSEKSEEFPIDTAGVMPDGKRRFNGPVELKQRIIEDREAFLRGLTEALMTYGLGRTIGFSDGPQIDKIVSATIKKEYRLRTLIHEIVRSDAFTKRSP